VIDETRNAAEMPYLSPSWQIHPPIGNEGIVMYNEYSDCHRRRAINTMLKTGGPALSEVLVGFEDYHYYFDQPASILLYPVHNHFDKKDRTLVGFVTITFHWLGTFWNILPHNVRGVDAVIETSSGQKTSFRVNGKHVSSTMYIVFTCLMCHHLLTNLFLSGYFYWRRRSSRQEMGSYETELKCLPRLRKRKRRH
jgi:hypothetical protein